MPACTFFGHRDCPENIRPVLTQTIIDLHCHKGVDFFYVGNQGRFDEIVLSVLRELKSLNLNFDYAVVLAYLPEKHHGFTGCKPEETMLPEGIETSHPKFAISKRNDWMLHNSEYVVAYTPYNWGGAAKFTSKAQKQHKTILSIT